MSSFSYDSIFDSSLGNALSLYWNSLTSYLSTVAVSLHENLPDNLHFNEFQWKLLKVFAAILIINLLLVCVAWKVYGRNICERFMKPATSKATEELEASVSKLKLPKEHTPRI